jgi:heat shock protein HspQ
MESNPAGPVDRVKPVSDMKPDKRGASDIMAKLRTAKFQLGQIVRHRFFPFRGVIFDVDPEFANTEEWWQSIPAEMRPKKDQPFYHLLAENDETEYVAYVSEQNLIPDNSGEPLRHPQIAELFDDLEDGVYRSRYVQEH